MRNFENDVFNKILNQIKHGSDSCFNISLTETEIIFLKYFLVDQSYFAVVVDDYLFEIVDKSSLLEALFYQIGLVTMHNLNWDAFHDALWDTSKQLSLFGGICLIFKKKYTNPLAIKEINFLKEFIEEINDHNDRIRLIILTNS